jgi:hypothetical protein
MFSFDSNIIFSRSQIQVRWENFDAVAIRPFVGAEKHADPAVIAAHFPFTQFFANAPQPLFKVCVHRQIRVIEMNKIVSGRHLPGRLGHCGRLLAAYSSPVRANGRVSCVRIDAQWPRSNRVFAG